MQYEYIEGLGGMPPFRFKMRPLRRGKTRFLVFSLGVLSQFLMVISNESPTSRPPLKIEAPLKIQAFFQVSNFKNILEEYKISSKTPTSRTSRASLPQIKHKHPVERESKDQILEIEPHHIKSTEACAKMIIVDELSFKVACPKFDPPSRVTIVKDIYQLYHDKNKKLKSFLVSNSQRLLTATVILLESLLRVVYWNEGLINPNEWEISYIKKKLRSWKTLILEGELLHLRCCAHIINLIVNEGLKEMHDFIACVHNDVRIHDDVMVKVLVDEIEAYLMHLYNCYKSQVDDFAFHNDLSDQDVVYEEVESSNSLRLLSSGVTMETNESCRVLSCYKRRRQE
uniref:Uncharacterized protein n=1 Tax=Cucumis melo TaxID=3656 RepID=A0A9I9EGA5_CUCME